MTEPIDRVATSRPRPRISAIVEPMTHRSTGRVATSADLAFVDAAIALLRAGDGQRDEAAGVVSVADVAAEDLIFVASDVTNQAELCFVVVNAALIGEDQSAVRLARRLHLAPEVSLEKLIKARNELAKALDVPARAG